MKILITGGLGFIGKSLARKLLNKNIKVFVFDHFLENKIDRNTKGAIIIKGDVRDIEAWGKIPPCDYVFHFGAPSSVILFNRDPSSCIDITIKGLVNAFQWSSNNKVKKLIYPSSGSIFGQPLNLYGKTKLACEYIAKIYENKVPNLGLRIFAGYGPQEENKGEIASVVTLFLKKMLKNEPPVVFGNGRQTRDFIYIDDIVDILLKSLEPSFTGVVNVGSGETTSFNELINKINKLLGRQIKTKYIPKPKEYLNYLSCDISYFIKKLGRKPLTLEEGLKKYLKALKK